MLFTHTLPPPPSQSIEAGTGQLSHLDRENTHTPLGSGIQGKNTCLPQATLRINKHNSTTDFTSGQCEKRGRSMIQQSENFLLKWPSLEEGEWERTLNKLKKKKKNQALVTMPSSIPFQLFPGQLQRSPRGLLASNLASSHPSPQSIHRMEKEITEIRSGQLLLSFRNSMQTP